MSRGAIGERLHLEKTDLVEAASEDVDCVPVVCGALREGVVELESLLVVLGLVALHAERSVSISMTYACNETYS